MTDNQTPAAGAEEAANPTNVLLAVTGCIAAYKACEVLRGLQKAGCDVRVVMTQDAEQFVGPVSFEALSGHPVADDLYTYPEGPIPHIELSEWADLILVCPATANVIAKMAAGIADDCLTSTILAAASDIAIAPAMNVRMWENPATQANVEVLKARGVHVIGPITGRLACGDVGTGKLEEVDVIVKRTLEILRGGDDVLPFDVERDLAGTSVVITAGPTREHIDPVRYISNESSGKMGIAIARAALARGADVTLVLGPVSLEPPRKAKVVRVISAAQMHDAALGAFEGSDVAICAAAVADYTPKLSFGHKVKKDEGGLASIELVETADILADLSARKGDRVVVGFAAETNDLLGHAKAKLAKKGCDLIVANDVSRTESTFGSDTNRVTLVSANGTEELPVMPKDDVAHALLDRVAALLGRSAKGN